MTAGSDRQQQRPLTGALWCKMQAASLIVMLSVTMVVVVIVRDCCRGGCPDDASVMHGEHERCCLNERNARFAGNDARPSNFVAIFGRVVGFVVSRRPGDLTRAREVARQRAEG